MYQEVDISRKVCSLFLFENLAVFLSNSKGIRTYAPGWKSPTEALFQSIKSYQNRWGIFLHGTQNVRINDALIAHHEKGGVLYFGNGNANIIEDSRRKKNLTTTPAISPFQIFGLDSCLTMISKHGRSPKNMTVENFMNFFNSLTQ